MIQEDFYMYNIHSDKQANEEIAKRIEAIQKLYGEVLEIAHYREIRVDFDLKSEYNRGHNRDTWVHWNPSSQHC